MAAKALLVQDAQTQETPLPDNRGLEKQAAYGWVSDSGCLLQYRRLEEIRERDPGRQRGRRKDAKCARYLGQSLGDRSCLHPTAARGNDARQPASVRSNALSGQAWLVKQLLAAN